MEPINCPICLDLLVAPIGWSCGHTVCVLCDCRILNGRCAICKSPISTFRQINRLLERLIQKQSGLTEEEYDRLAKARIALSNQYSVCKKYKTSTRYMNISDILVKELKKGNIKKDQLIQAVERATTNYVDKISPDEIEYVLFKMQVITINEWIIPDFKHAITFLKSNKDLTEDQKNLIYQHFAPRLKKMFTACGIQTPRNSISKQITDNLVSYLSTIKLETDTRFTGATVSDDW